MEKRKRGVVVGVDVAGEKTSNRTDCGINRYVG